MPAVVQHHAVGLDPRSGPQEDVEVQGQRRRADKPIKQFGADAVRYWAAAARLGLDATYDEGQMKIGRRLAIKLLNATKFALAIGLGREPSRGRSGSRRMNPADVTEPIDRSAMSKMAAVVREATDDLTTTSIPRFWKYIENYFWQFCDDYIELVKNRAYGTADSTGTCRARPR